MSTLRHHPLYLSLRDFLNQEYREGTAAIAVRTDADYEGESFWGYELSISDCNRRINLEFSAESTVDMVNSIYKANLLLKYITSIRDNLVIHSKEVKKLPALTDGDGQ